MTGLDGCMHAVTGSLLGLASPQTSTVTPSWMLTACHWTRSRQATAQPPRVTSQHATRNSSPTAHHKDVGMRFLRLRCLRSRLMLLCYPATANSCCAELQASPKPKSSCVVGMAAWLQSAAWLVTGTLGLAYPTTRHSMRRAVQAAKEGGCKVRLSASGLHADMQNYQTCPTPLVCSVATCEHVCVYALSCAGVGGRELEACLLEGPRQCRMTLPSSADEKR